MASSTVDVLTRFLLQQLQLGVAPVQVVRAARNRWPSITTSEIVAANRAALAEQRSKASADAAAITTAAKSRPAAPAF